MEDFVKWDMRFLALAKFISLWSKDQSTKVGAVITNERRLVSVGYNGFPQGIKDSEEIIKSDRDGKLARTIHAETNAMIFSNQNLNNKTIYVYPMFPCSNCCASLIQAGISRVVTVQNTIERWQKSIDISLEMCKEANVRTTIYDEILSEFV